MKHKLFLLLLLFLPVALSAQSGLLRKAQKKIDALDFQGAIQILEPKLSRRATPAGAALLGDCYRRTGRFSEAEHWYGKVGDWSEVHPQYLLSHARTLQRAGKYSDAQNFYDRYLGILPNDRLALEQRRACSEIETYQRRGMGWWEVQSLPLNSAYREFGPVCYEDALVFCSDRPADGPAKYQDAWTGEGFLDIYSAPRKTLDPSQCASFSYGTPVVFYAPLSSKYHEASAHFSPDHQVIYFTTNAVGSGSRRDDEGLLRLQIMYARRLPRNRGWTDPLSLSINSSEYSVMHPCLAPGGRRLYFSSDMPGGFGGPDLYYVEMINDVWGPPVNLGPGINTQGSEVFPYIDSDGALYFSSDGWGGMGGLDIFVVKSDGEAPYNPGFPLNSMADDFGFTWEEKDACGYFSSDRPGGEGKDDIYLIRKISHPLQLQIKDAWTGAFPGGVILRADCRTDSLAVSDGQGQWEMPHNACCQVTATAPGYDPATLTRCTYNMSPGQSISAELLLTPRPEYRLEGIIFEESTGLPLDGALVQILHRDTGEEVASSRTTFSGRYDLEVGGGACYLIRVSKSGYATWQQNGPCIGLKAPGQVHKERVYLKK